MNKIEELTNQADAMQKIKPDFSNIIYNFVVGRSLCKEIKCDYDTVSVNAYYE